MSSEATHTFTRKIRYVCLLNEKRNFPTMNERKHCVKTKEIEEERQIEWHSMSNSNFISFGVVGRLTGTQCLRTSR